MNQIKTFEMDFQNATLTFHIDADGDTFEFSFTECDTATIMGQDLSIVSFNDDAAPGCVSMQSAAGKPLYLDYLNFCQMVECW